MSLDTVSNHVVAICFSKEELEKLGYNTALSGDKARQLVRNALKEKGVAPWIEMEIELFSCAQSLLIMARRARRRTYRFVFRDSEALLSAVAGSADEISSRLTLYEDTFYLDIEETEEKIPSALFEFGDPAPLDPDFSAHIAEHGKQLIDHFAISTLKEKFKL